MLPYIGYFASLSNPTVLGKILSLLKCTDTVI